MKKFEKTIISQYSNSPTIISLISGMNDSIDPRADIDKFFEYVFNVDTAQGFGLDIWGRIVGINRKIKTPRYDVYFGFDSPTKSYKNFNHGVFKDSSFSIEGTIELPDEEFRKIIMLKALSNISDCTAPTINKLLNKLFYGRGRSYVNDLGGMEIRYVFDFELQPYEIALIQNSDVMVRPAGVEFTLFVNPRKTFGFDGGGILITGFNQAPFISEK